MGLPNRENYVKIHTSLATYQVPKSLDFDKNETFHWC